MSSERNILKRLLEGVEPEYAPDIEKDEEDLEEASFEANGKIFKAAFGHYTCDGEPISREDYFAAKEGGNVSTGNAKGAEEPKATRESPYAKYGFNKKPTEKTAAKTIGKYLSKDSTVRDMAYVLFDHGGKYANIVNHDRKLIPGQYPGDHNSYEGSVDKLIKGNEEYQKEFEKTLTNAMKDAEKDDDKTHSGILNMIKDRYEEKSGRKIGAPTKAAKGASDILKGVTPSASDIDDMEANMGSDYEYMADEVNKVKQVLGADAAIKYVDNGDGDTEDFQRVKDLVKSSGAKPQRINGKMSSYDVGDGNQVIFSNNDGLHTFYFKQG